MPVTWNRFGNVSTANLSDDWPRTLAHELGHYIFFLDDNYLGRDSVNRLISINDCPGVMTDPYNLSDEEGFDEFHPGDSDAWASRCGDTLAAQETGRWDWQTIRKFYPMLMEPAARNSDGSSSSISGPNSLPLDVTQISFHGPESAPTDPTQVDAPIFRLSFNNKRHLPGPDTRAFLFQDRDVETEQWQWITDLGSPTLDQVEARGAQLNDRICVFEPDESRLGCTNISQDNRKITLVEKMDWRPNIDVTPVNSRTIGISVDAITETVSLKAQLFPLNHKASDVVTLPQDNGFKSQIKMDEPPLEGYIHVWVDEPEPKREAILDYTLSGNPGYRWARGGYRWARGVSVGSADGQVLLAGDNLVFDDGEFYTLIATNAVNKDKPWLTQIGKAYRINTTPTAPRLDETSISLSYLGSQASDAIEPWINVYYSDGESWQKLPTQRDPYHNFASARAQGEGMYTLMATVPISLSTPGWNFVGYPIQGSRLVTEALKSIEGTYQTVLGHSPAANDPWPRYDATIPEEFDELFKHRLKRLEFGKGYWIYVDKPATLYLNLSDLECVTQEQRDEDEDCIATIERTDNMMAAQAPAPISDVTVSAQITPPALASFYGWVGDGSTIDETQTITSTTDKNTMADNMVTLITPITAEVDGTICGSTFPELLKGRPAYAIALIAAEPDSPNAACSGPGAEIVFKLGDQVVGQAMWGGVSAEYLDLVVEP